MLYAPDYASNAVAISNNAYKDCVAGTYDKVGALKAAGRIDDTLAEIFTRADAMALERAYKD